MSTPAKINLGLEIVQRRDDGYHNIVTVLQAVSVFDHFIWHHSMEPLRYHGVDGVRTRSDLVRKALDNVPRSEELRGILQIEKQIPLSAGLGGGSSDAALALRLAGAFQSRKSIELQAEELGSDVPFFVGGGTSLATGTGTTLNSLPTPELWFVIVVPDLVIHQKTIKMYRGLEPSDFSDGSHIFGFAGQLQKKVKISSQLPNAFARQLLEFEPVAQAWATLEHAGGTCISVSGAGPSIFAVFDHAGEAQTVFERLPVPPGKKFLARSLADHFDDAAVFKVGKLMRGLQI